jgi:hypothetical protein
MAPACRKYGGSYVLGEVDFMVQECRLRSCSGYYGHLDHYQLQLLFSKEIIKVLTVSGSRSRIFILAEPLPVDPSPAAIILLM